jgi:hypothetical protein
MLTIIEAFRIARRYGIDHEPTILGELAQANGYHGQTANVVSWGVVHAGDRLMWDARELFTGYMQEIARCEECETREARDSERRAY